MSGMSSPRGMSSQGIDSTLAMINNTNLMGTGMSSPRRITSGSMGNSGIEERMFNQEANRRFVQL